jgi:hypothetical protein
MVERRLWGVVRLVERLWVVVRIVGGCGPGSRGDGRQAAVGVVG